MEIIDAAERGFIDRDFWNLRYPCTVFMEAQ
jgi:hypothetical protein